MADIPDYSVKQVFPISSVISAAQQNAALQQQARQQGQQSLIEGLQSIGGIGQSLYDTKKRIAQSLALGRQFDIPDDVAKTMDPSQVLQVGTIKRGQIDMSTLLNLLHPGSGGTSPGASPVSQTTPASPSGNGAILASQVTPETDTNQPSVPSFTPPATSSTAVPIAAPPSKMVSPATFNAAFKLANANRQDPVMTNEAALAAKQVPHGTRIAEPRNSSLNVGMKEEQFYQREWDKLLKESDPLNASSRTPLGLASRATFQANRALKTLSNPVVTNQEAGNAMADIAAIYQNGSPTQFGMSHQEYETAYGKAKGVLQMISGKPQDALPDAIKSRLIGVLNDMKNTNSALLKQRLDMTEHSKKSVISHFPQEWQEYRQILEGDQEPYSGLPKQAVQPAQADEPYTADDEKRYQFLISKQRKGSIRL